MHMCVCVCEFACDICLTVAAVAVFITLCIRDRPPFRHYIISPDQHVSLHCTGCHKSDKLEIHTLCCLPPTPACILHHTEIIVEFVAIRMHTAQHCVVVDAWGFGAVENLYTIQMFSPAPFFILGMCVCVCVCVCARFSKDVLIYIFFFYTPFVTVYHKKCDDSVVLNVTIVFSPCWGCRTEMTLLWNTPGPCLEFLILPSFHDLAITKMYSFY